MFRVGLRFATAALVTVLALAGAGTALGSDAAGGATLRDLIHNGEKAPSFALDDLDGRRLAVTPGDGKPSLLVFFSAFCPLCRELTPSVRDIASRRYGRRAIRVIGVNLDGKRFSNAVRSFVKEHGIGFPVLLDEIRNDMFVASDPYGVDKTPTAVLVDGKGIVRGAYAADAMRNLVNDFERIAAGLDKGNGVAQ